MLCVPFYSRHPSLPSFCVELLQTATYLINILPTKTLQNSTPHLALFGKAPTYDHLCVFSCKCYPNLSATAPHKLSPRSTHCVFLGYSAHHKGYRCLDLSSDSLIIPRHVIFDESSFPYAERGSSPSVADIEFLDATDFVPAPIGVAPKFPFAGPSSAQPRAAAPSVDLACLAVHDAFPAGLSPSDTPSPVLAIASSPALPLAASVQPRAALRMDLLPTLPRAASASPPSEAQSPSPGSPASSSMP